MLGAARHAAAFSLADSSMRQGVRHFRSIAAWSECRGMFHWQLEEVGDHEMRDTPQSSDGLQ
jgi:hypothetical protein